MTENSAADAATAAAAAATDQTPETGTASNDGAAGRVWLLATFRVSSSHPFVLDGRDVPGAVRELEDIMELIEGEGVAVRGWYDVTGFRSDADLLLWLTAGAAEDLQWGYRELRRTAILRPLVRSGSSIVAVEGSAADAAEAAAADPAAELGAGDAGAWLAVLGLSGARHGGAGASNGEAAHGGVAALDVSAGERIEVVETATAAELFGRLQEKGSRPVHLGRLVTPVELVEVLQ